MRARRRRAGQYARSQARDQYLSYVREHWRLFASIFTAVYLITFAVHRLWPHQFNDLFVGAMLVVPLWIVSLLVVGRPGTAAWARGADAEEWTSSTLRKCLGRRYVVVNDIQLGASNIDHVAIGPAGVFVIETKWSGDPWASPGGEARIDAARKQATDGSRRVRRALEGEGRVESPEPVVVLWGGRTREWSDKKILSSVRRAVPVVPGTAMDTWAARLTPGVLDEGQRRAVAAIVVSMSVNAAMD